MTDLSPAARAVLDTAYKTYRYNPTDPFLLRHAVAAALRAAANHMAAWADGDDCTVALDDLFAIAAELDGPAR